MMRYFAEGIFSTHQTMPCAPIAMGSMRQLIKEDRMFPAGTIYKKEMEDLIVLMITLSQELKMWVALAYERLKAEYEKRVIGRANSARQQSFAGQGETDLLRTLSIMPPEEREVVIESDNESWQERTFIYGPDPLINGVLELIDREMVVWLNDFAGSTERVVHVFCPTPKMVEHVINVRGSKTT